MTKRANPNLKKMKQLLKIFISAAFFFVFIQLNAQKSNTHRNTYQELLDKNNELREIRRFYKNGNIKCIIPIKHDLVHGKVKCFRKNGKLKAENNYSQGKQHGKQYSYMKKSTYIMTYENGIEDKIFHVIRYSKEGKIREEYNNKFVEGYGPYKLYYKNGQLKTTGSYNGTRRNGDWTFYNKDGSVKITKSYENKVVFSNN